MGGLGKFFNAFVHRVIVATGILIFSVVYLVDISSLNSAQDKLMVNPIIWIIILLYPLIIWKEWKEWKEVKQSADTGEKESDEVDESSAKLSKKVFLFMLSTLIYLVLMNYLGFLIMTIIYVPTLMWILGTTSKKVLIILPIAFTLLLFYLFNNLLGIPIPSGLLLEGVL
ncbi:tripartite tricarboxylate transporter TctB family protein [Oceanobacillus sp. FSL W7-1293]|uniref:tripartite tricarboxylate transporter TctB family protein n=1 Tax=Oceanobacillus sp. FSL W7-1293 TaxID=2921699 RepID=UPI0030D255E7